MPSSIDLTRPDNALGGVPFTQTLPDAGGPTREELVSAEILRGNVPPSLTGFCEVACDHAGHTGVFYVLPEYLAIGSDEDFVRVPLTPGTAQRIADTLGCSLPTPKMVDLIWAVAGVKLEPQPIPPDARMETTARFVQHNALIERARAGSPLGALTAGHKKDVVITAALLARPGHVAIYGWQRLNEPGHKDGSPIQPLNAVSHSSNYADYSHGIRLVGNVMSVDGNPMALVDVLRDPDLCGLVSGEGVLTSPRYPIG